MHVLSALLYLRLTSLQNFLRAQLRRLRQPKYLAGAVFVVMYFWFLVFRNFSNAWRHIVFFPGGMGSDPQALMLAFGALGLTAILTGMWIFPSDKPGLRFTEAEITFLFPAPLTRRLLIHYKLLSSLWSTLVQAFFFSLIFHRGHILNRHAPQVILAWWTLLSVISLHNLGSALTIGRLAESGFGAGRRRFLILGVLGLVILATGWWTWREIPDIMDFTSMFDWIGAILNGGVLRWLLWPAKIILQPLSATGFTNYCLALAPVALILAVQYWWVRNMDASFEEASIARAAQLATRRAQIQAKGSLNVGPTKGRPAPFDVSRTRWVEFAFLWKNLLSTRPYFTLRNWLICAGIIVVIWRGCGMWLGHEYWRAGGTLAAVGSIAGGMALVYGPLIARLDIRQDLINADILKTYPLPGWRIVLGQLLTPVVILTGIIWLSLLAWYLGLHGHQPPAFSTTWLSPAMRAVFCCCIAALTPLLVTLLLLVPNGAAILFPAVFGSLRTAGAGIDLMGQRMIFGLGQVAVIFLSLLPAGAAAGVFGAIAYGLFKVDPAIVLILATLIVAPILTGQIWCVSWWLGERFEKLDLSSELRP